MNLNLCLGRGSFHPAWLLLVLPPLLWPQDDNLIGIPWIFQFLGAIPILLILVPVTGLARRQATSLSLRLGKEFRAQMPGALLAIVAPSLLMMSGDRESAHHLATIAYVLGCAVLGATAFGAEFDQRTMGSLLTQPLRRGTLFSDKLVVLGLLLAVAASQFFLCNEVWAHHEPRVWVEGMEATLAALVSFAPPPLIAFCTGPMLSLRTRNTLASAVFVVAIPLILVLIGQLLLSAVWHWRHPGETLSDYAPHLSAWCWSVLSAYALLAAWIGWRSFARLELADNGPAPSGTHPLAGILDGGFRALWPHRSANGTVSLIRKELRLQVVPWLVSGLMVGFSILLMLVTRYSDSGQLLGFGLKDLGNLLAILTGGLNLHLIGCAAIAEERQLGTLDWQLTCPATVRRQWWVKVGVTGALSVLAGVILPYLLLVRFEDGKHLTDHLPEYSWLIAVQVTAGLCAISGTLYASSLSRSTVKAAFNAIAVQFGIVLLTLGVFKIFAVSIDAIGTGLFALMQEAANQHKPLPPPSIIVTADVARSLSGWALALGPLPILGLLLGAGARNFRFGIPTGWRLFRQLAGLTLGVLLIASTVGSFCLMVVEKGFEYSAYQNSLRAPQRKPAPAVKRTPTGTNQPAAMLRGIDPALAKRYGLYSPSAGATTNGASLGGRTNTGVDLYLRDAALAKRYGLMVRPVPSTNASAPAK